jgi:hypothetical protein
MVLQVGLSKGANLATTAIIEIVRGEARIPRQVVAGAGVATIELPTGDGPVSVLLHPGADGKRAKWINPMLVQRPN